VLAAACALLAIRHLHIGAGAATWMSRRIQHRSPPRRASKVKSDSLTLVTKVNPVYPRTPKKNKVTGSVVLAATIGKDGTVEKLRVVSGPSALQRAALEAVQTVALPALSC